MGLAFEISLKPQSEVFMLLKDGHILDSKLKRNDAHFYHGIMFHGVHNTHPMRG